MSKSFIGLVLVLLGVSVAAVFGARNTPGVNDALAIQGAAEVASKNAKAAYDAYCAALKEAQEQRPALKAAALSDKCIVEEAPERTNTSAKADAETEAAPTLKASPPAPTYEEALQSGEAAYTALAARVSLTDDTLSKKRTAWLKAEKAALIPQATKASSTVSAPEPAERLAAWLGQSGLGFLGGLALIIVGGVVARKAQRETALSDGPKESERAGPVDFGQLLEVLNERLAELVTAESGGELAETLLSRIETIQFEHVEPLIDSRQKVQARFGMEGFADIFSPLSGGERNLNRAWSALVDQHRPEAKSAIQNAARLVGDAKAALHRHL